MFCLSVEILRCIVYIAVSSFKLYYTFYIIFNFRYQNLSASLLWILNDIFLYYSAYNLLGFSFFSFGIYSLLCSFSPSYTSFVSYIQALLSLPKFLYTPTPRFSPPSSHQPSRVACSVCWHSQYFQLENQYNWVSLRLLSCSVFLCTLW